MKKLTLVKVSSKDKLDNLKPSELEQMVKDNIVTTEQYQYDETDLILVKINNQSSKLSQEDLLAWRGVFESAKDDKEFVIFTHQDISIELIKFDKNGYIKVLA